MVTATVNSVQNYFLCVEIFYVSSLVDFLQWNALCGWSLLWLCQQYM